jgi:hypothetical protein
VPNTCGAGGMSDTSYHDFSAISCGTNNSAWLARGAGREYAACIKTAAGAFLYLDTATCQVVAYLCAAGTYTSDGSRTMCFLCNAGYLCPPGSTSNLGSGACGAGYYCPAGASRTACPIGT